MRVSYRTLHACPSWQEEPPPPLRPTIEGRLPADGYTGVYRVNSGNCTHQGFHVQLAGPAHRSQKELHRSANPVRENATRDQNHPGQPRRFPAIPHKRSVTSTEGIAPSRSSILRIRTSPLAGREHSKHPWTSSVFAPWALSRRLLFPAPIPRPNPRDQREN